MKWSDANRVVEDLRGETQLYLPPLSQRRGFSSSRVEHLLNRLVGAMPQGEAYFEVGVLEGRTLEAASVGNEGKRLIGCDPCLKYEIAPKPFAVHVQFLETTWAEALYQLPKNLGVVFYDGDHSAAETAAFMVAVEPFLADEAVLVLDDWDRASVREGAFKAAEGEHWRLLREMPEYTDGLTTTPHHLGYQFGVSLWGFRR